MAKYFAILEDNADRIVAMRTIAAGVLPDFEIVIFENASEMITWLREHLGDVMLISLDHDLPLRNADGHAVDFGTGRQVADYLASIPPTCPVIIHSSNEIGASGMFFALKDAGWPCSRVYPSDDLEWVESAWAKQVRRYRDDGWIAGSGRS